MKQEVNRHHAALWFYGHIHGRQYTENHRVNTEEKQQRFQKI